MVARGVSATGAVATGLLTGAAVAGLAVGRTAALLVGLATVGLVVVLAVVAFGVEAGRTAVLLWASAGALVRAQKRRAEVKCVFIGLGKLSSK